MGLYNVWLSHEAGVTGGCLQQAADNHLLNSPTCACSVWYIVKVAVYLCLFFFVGSIQKYNIYKKGVQNFYLFKNLAAYYNKKPGYTDKVLTVYKRSNWIWEIHGRFVHTSECDCFCLHVHGFLQTPFRCIGQLQKFVTCEHTHRMFSDIFYVPARPIE